jgi:hypothetical protein
VDVEFGNVGAIDTNGTGWVVAYSDWARSGDTDLRYMNKHALSHTLAVKWYNHKKGDPKGTGKPLSEGRSISFLVSEKGRFRIDFSEVKDFPEGRTETHVLERHGDFVIWGEGVYHRWFADEDSSILTVRWVPVQPPSA